MGPPKDEAPDASVPGPEARLARLLPGLGRVDLAKLVAHLEPVL
jgi:hypothetical protein